MNTRIQIISNTNFALANVLKSELFESKKVNIAVAFLRKTGIDLLIDAIHYALTKNNAQIEIIVGLDFKTTDQNALFTLSELKSKHKGFEFYCFGDKKDNFNDLVFHPKIYLLSNENTLNPKYTSVVGSSNLTAGGLSGNFEVNTVFEEKNPVYYSQLIAIYNAIKFTDSIFIPDKDYLQKYVDVKKDIDKNENKSEKLLKEKITNLQREEELLPGTILSQKKIIIEVMKKKLSEGVAFLTTAEIYQEARNYVAENNLRYKMDTFDNSLRGELVKNEINYDHPDNLKLFKRIATGKYTLTDKAYQYFGR